MCITESLLWISWKLDACACDEIIKKEKKIDSVEDMGDIFGDIGE